MEVIKKTRIEIEVTYQTSFVFTSVRMTELAINQRARQATDSFRFDDGDLAHRYVIVLSAGQVKHTRTITPASTITLHACMYRNCVLSYLSSFRKIDIHAL